MGGATKFKLSVPIYLRSDIKNAVNKGNDDANTTSHNINCA
jgi:hypothetical protein